MTSPSKFPIWRALLMVMGGLGGLIAAMIVIFNLHILVGLEEGYAATPAQVWEFSGVLAVLDMVLLIGGPAVGAFALWGATRRRTVPG